MQSIATGVYGSSFNWTIPTSLPAGSYRARVTSDLSGAIAATSQPFLITNSGQFYYVNGSSTGGVFTTAGGNDANDGKSPSTPMSSIQAVLNADHPGPGSTIYIDTGTYNLLGNIILTSADSGITFEGVPAQTTILNRGNGNVGEYVFDLHNVNNVTFDHLAITGAYAGINGGFNETSSNITVSNDLIYSNSAYGISTNDQTGWLVTGNSIHDTGSGGIGISFLNYISNTFTSNTVFNNPATAFVQTTRGSVSAISGNTVFSNNIGIYAAANNGTITISDNTVFSNANTASTPNPARSSSATPSSSKPTPTPPASSSSTPSRRATTPSTTTSSASPSPRATPSSTATRSIPTPAPGSTSSTTASRRSSKISSTPTPAPASTSTASSTTVLHHRQHHLRNHRRRREVVSSPGVTVRNNILWTQNGFDLDLDPQARPISAAITTTCSSAGQPKSVFWRSAQATLANWQSASSRRPPLRLGRSQVRRHRRRRQRPRLHHRGRRRQRRSR